MRLPLSSKPITGMHAKCVAVKPYVWNRTYVTTTREKCGSSRITKILNGTDPYRTRMMKQALVAGRIRV